MAAIAHRMTAAGLCRLPENTGPVYQELRHGELDASGVRDPTRAPAGTPIPLPFGSQDPVKVDDLLPY